MDFAAYSEEAAEAHDQWTPAHRVDMGTGAFAYQQLFVHVQFHDMHLEHVSADVFSEGPVVVNDRSRLPVLRKKRQR